MSEKDYIVKILKGDTSSFGYFVDSYQDMALTMAFRICKNRQDAEDIVQNSFVKAFHALSSFRLDSKFSTWFYRIVYNTAITSIQSSVFTAEYMDYNILDDENYIPDWGVLETIEQKERNTILNAALEQIPEGESLILTLFYLEENSIKEIGEITGLSQSNIKVRLHRARISLKEVLEKNAKKEELWIS